jgi:general L-amino acid transport system substrate-binding protein
MRKPLVWRLLAVLLGLSLLAAACGDDSSGDGDAADGDGDAAEPADEDGDAAEPADEPADGDSEDTVDVTQGGSLLQTIQDRGVLICGVSGAGTGFSVPDPDGNMVGFDADMCRANAAAILGDSTAVEFVALTAAERFTALAAGDVDLLHRNTTWTQSRDTDVGGDFGPTTFFDGQQLMGRVADGFSADSRVADVDGAVVCTNAGTTTEKNIAEAARLEGADFGGITLNTFEDFNQVTDAFIAGTCDIITTDGSGLVGRRAVNDALDDWAIFPATPISKEPLGPMYRQNDSQFADVVNWTVYAMIIADENGVTSQNIDDFLDAEEYPELGRLFGSGEDELQSAMGLTPDAFYQVITQVGNYDEVYARHLNPLGLVREGSANARWYEGGLIYAPPAR